MIGVDVAVNAAFRTVNERRHEIVNRVRVIQREDPKRKRAQSFSTWLYSSSTGVARPKIETATLRRARP